MLSLDTTNITKYHVKIGGGDIRGRALPKQMQQDSPFLMSVVSRRTSFAGGLLWSSRRGVGSRVVVASRVVMMMASRVVVAWRLAWGDDDGVSRRRVSWIGDEWRLASLWVGEA